MLASPAFASYAHLNSRFLEGLAPPELRSVLGAAKERRFFANSVVYNQDHPIHTLYLLVEGRARFFYVTPKGHKLIGPSILPGEIFGATAVVMSKSTYIASTETVKNSSVLTWERGTIRGLVRRYPRLLDNTLSIMAGYLDWTVAAYIGLACHSARLRLAQALLNLVQDSGGQLRSGAELHVTNEELASAANVTPFTTSRVMSEWRRRGALKKSRGKVLLRSPVLLFSRET